MAPKEDMNDTAPLPLDGIRVIELGNYIAAPTAGRMLADFGADVIKIERPQTGDELRNWRLHEGTTSMLYRTINRNKRSVTLDLRSDEGREAVLALIASADVVLENFRPGTLEKWGLGPEVLERVAPDVILVRISAFGQTGPMAERPGFAAVAEAYGGFRELVGDPDRPPVRVGVSIGDTIAGMQAAFGALMRLFERERGRAPAHRRVDVALNEAMFSVLESLVPEFSAFGVGRTRTGGRMEGIAPSNAYLCAGGKSVVIAGNGDGIFVRFMTAIGRPDLAADPDLADNAGRWRRREELDEAIGAWTRERDPGEVLATLAEAGVPAGPIQTAEDLVDDSQLRARGMLQPFTVSTGERDIESVVFPGISPVLDSASVPVRHLGPDLGADTEAVLAELGLAPATTEGAQQ